MVCWCWRGEETGENGGLEGDTLSEGSTCLRRMCLSTGILGKGEISSACRVIEEAAAARYVGVVVVELLECWGGRR